MYLKIVLISISALILHHIGSFIYQFGFKLRVYNHSPGPCKYVDGIDHDPEDLHTLSNGLTFISEFVVEYADPTKYQHHMGHIYLYDLSKDSNQKAIKLEFQNYKPQRFIPHGISAWQDDKGKVTLFVVNHLHVEWDVIESFEYLPDQKALRHVSTYRDGSMRNLNDVVATSHKTFYFTNWSHFRSMMGYMLEMFLLLPWTTVYYHDGEGYQLVAEDLVMANGIAMSNDHKFVYVVCTMTKDIKVFKRDTDNRLIFHQKYLVDNLVDNISVDAEGNLWTGGHPMLFGLFNNKAPSQVLKLETKAGLITSMKEVYSNDGSEQNGSTAASFYQNKTLIGSLTGKLLVCDVMYI
ncbi:serum paraoxonase/lactonase 3-like, partial [Argonauta hians]